MNEEKKVYLRCSHRTIFDPIPTPHRRLREEEKAELTVANWRKRFYFRCLGCGIVRSSKEELGGMLLTLVLVPLLIVLALGFIVAACIPIGFLVLVIIGQANLTIESFFICVVCGVLTWPIIIYIKIDSLRTEF